ncbi:uncharacterized protein LOC131247127 [Magnolia sinica]|uniref:uncharacterized protein LOC131247127 n=1 Tax=Magnolia sinica TaxID=86752 RepID=UPI002657E778|nr:uncharacterized protein LOC131247127 [Magnolia sinica]
MGNHIACIHQLPPHPAPARTIKLIKSDGHVKIYDRPIAASELMLQFPKHLICHSDSFFIGQKIPALSATDHLKLGHKYFLLPTHFFQSVLSFVTIASIASSSSPIPPSPSSKKADFIKKAALCRPFDIHKTPSGMLQIRVSDEFISKLMEEGRIKGEDEEGEEENSRTKPKGRVCTTPELEKDYIRLVGFRRSKEWKPKLETIREKKERRKFSSFGIKRRKKGHLPKGSQKSQKSEQQQHLPAKKSQKSEQQQQLLAKKNQKSEQQQQLLAKKNQKSEQQQQLLAKKNQKSEQQQHLLAKKSQKSEQQQHLPAKSKGKWKKVL